MQLVYIRPRNHNLIKPQISRFPYPLQYAGNWPDLAGPFNTMLARLLNKIRQPDDRPPFNIRDPRYREYNTNKSVIEKELAWLCNPCRNEDETKAVSSTEHSAMGGK